MRLSVQTAFYTFTARFEGIVDVFYKDILGLVTIGVGNLVDPMSAALGLPMLRADGTPASQIEIAAEWKRIKTAPGLEKQGWRAAKNIATLRLSQDSIRTLVKAKCEANERALKARFSDFDAWPADAQLGLLSMAWAAGPAFKAPKFSAACQKKDFVTAAKECRFNDTRNPGLRPRNDANEALFRNAAQVVERDLNPEMLYYPTVLAA